MILKSMNILAKAGPWFSLQMRALKYICMRGGDISPFSTHGLFPAEGIRFKGASHNEWICK